MIPRSRKRLVDGQRPDPYYNNVAVMYDHDGLHNSTSFVDLSKHGHVATVSGNVKHVRNIDVPYGFGCVAFDGSGDFWSIPDHAAFAVGNQDYTFEAWVRRNGTNTNQSSICAQYSGSQRQQNFRYTASTIDAAWSTNGSATTGTNTANHTIGADKWAYIAVCRKALVQRFYVNGQLIHTVAHNVTYFNSTAVMHFGRLATAIPSSDMDFNGYVKSLRFTIGIGRYDGPGCPVPYRPFPRM